MHSLMPSVCYRHAFLRDRECQHRRKPALSSSNMTGKGCGELSKAMARKGGDKHVTNLESG
jgi:hypothetical protein